MVMKGRHMRLRLPKREAGRPDNVHAHFCEAIDRSIPVLRTLLIVAGLVVAAVRGGRLGDFLFVTGLLFHFAISFEHWWITKRTR
jgi:hypothetical protein